MTILGRVLVIESDSSVATDLCLALAPAAVEVAVVPSALSAIAWVDDHGVPDVAVIDLQIQDLTAATLVAILRRRAAGALPRFFVSRDARVGARFDEAPVLKVPFEAIEARAVLSETLIEADARRSKRT